MAVSLASLWLPILLSALAVWVLSFLVWAVLPWHKSDYAKLPDEEAARAALEDVPPGAYNIPHLPTRDALNQPEYRQKFEQGPVGFLFLLPHRVPGMGGTLVQWFVFNLVMAFLAAYVAAAVLGPGTSYLQVFQVVGTVTWLAYGFGIVPESIWFGRPWHLSIKQLVDALLYGLVTAGFFGWLWPA